MKVSTVAEEVTVSAESPVVDTKSANVNVNLDAKLLETTPGGKDIWNILEYKVPGLIFDTPDVGGNQAGLQRGVHGARHAERAERAAAERRQRRRSGGDRLLDELLRAERRSRTSRSRPARRTSRSARRASSINMVTKSGTNRFAGSGAADLPGRGDAVGQHRRALEAGGLPAERERGRTTSRTPTCRRAGRSSRTSCSTSGRSTIQPTHVNVPGFPAVSPIPSSSAAPAIRTRPTSPPARAG